MYEFCVKVTVFGYLYTKIAVKTYHLLAGLFLFCVACTAYDAQLAGRLESYAREGDFFRVRELLQDAGRKIPRVDYLYYTAICESKFDRCESSNRNIGVLLDHHSNVLSDSLVVELLSARADNHVRLYQYRLAAESYDLIAERYAGGLDSADVADYRNSARLFGALADVPGQRMTLDADVTIPAFRDGFGMHKVPVCAGGIPMDFVWDTGANLSTVTESCAEKLNFRILDTSIEVGSSTSAKANARLAVADSIRVGGILFEHVVFLVFPDELLSFPQVGLVIDGIIGFPVMHQMGEIDMYRTGEIVVPAVPQDRGLNNLYLDMLHPIVAVYAQGDTLLLNIDTGADRTELMGRYYDRHKEWVEGRAAKVTQHRGGMGGVEETEAYNLPDFDFTLGSKQVRLPTVTVIPGDFSFVEGRDGNLGQDVITQFDKMIVNFKYMYVDFD